MAVTFFGASALGAIAATPATLSVAYPAGVAANDIAIIMVLSKNITLPSNELNTPTGYTLLGSLGTVDSAVAADDFRYGVYWRRLDGSEGGTSVTVSRAGTSTLGFYALMVVFRGASTTDNPLAPAVTATTVVADNITYPVYTPGVASHAIYLGFYSNDLTTAGAIAGSDPTLTIQVDLETATGTDCTMIVSSGDSSGAAIGSRTQATTSSADSSSLGFVTALKIASSGNTYTPTVSGGGAFSGAAPSQLIRAAPAATNGIASGGTATKSTKRLTSGTGGLTIGGAATAALTRSYTIVPTGGLASGGSGVTLRRRSTAGVGGLVGAGAAVLRRSVAIVATGGLLASGTAPRVAKRVAPAPTDGLVAAGTAPAPTRRSVLPIGGGIFGGAATTFHTGGAQSFPYTGTGGATFGGTAPSALRRARVATGGAAFGGTAVVARRFGATPTGGIVVSGTARLARRQAMTGTGGILAGGLVRPGYRRVVLTSGGGAFGGAAPSNNVIVPRIPPATYIAVVSSASDMVVAGSRSKLEPQPSISDLQLNPSESTLKMSTHSMVEGDTLPPIIATLSWSASVAAIHPDLTDAQSVSFTMERISDNAVIINAGAATFVDRVAKIVKYQWAAGQTRGQYRGKFLIIFNNGDRLTVPTRNYLTINVEAP